jgi:hypothetical protein
MTLVLIVIYFTSLGWFLVLALAYYSHMVLDHLHLHVHRVLKLKEFHLIFRIPFYINYTNKKSQSQQSTNERIGSFCATGYVKYNKDCISVLKTNNFWFSCMYPVKKSKKTNFLNPKNILSLNDPFRPLHYRLPEIFCCPIHHH